MVIERCDRCGKEQPSQTTQPTWSRDLDMGNDGNGYERLAGGVLCDECDAHMREHLRKAWVAGLGGATS